MAAQTASASSATASVATVPIGWMHESDAGLLPAQKPVLPLDSMCGFAVIGRAIHNVAASTRIFPDEALTASMPPSVRPHHREAAITHESQVYLYSQGNAVEALITGNLPDPDQASNLYAAAAVLRSLL